jgi:hypothetical protein
MEGRPMAQLVCISTLVLVAIYFLTSAWRHSEAIKAADIYLEKFSNLADNTNVPFELLESLHGAFKSSCHQCAALYVVVSAFRYKFDRRYRKEVATAERPKHIENIDPKTVAQISETIASLFLYSSYSIPFFGILARPLIKRALNKAKSKDRNVVKDKADFFVFNVEHAMKNAA